jgi:hypothetical protein
MLVKTFGTANAETQKTMSGLELVQGLTSGALPLDILAETLGYDVKEAAHDRVVVRCWTRA